MHLKALFYREKLQAVQQNAAKKLETLEKEAENLRSKMQVLELDNEKIGNENKKLALHAARLARKDSNTLMDKDKAAELIRLKESFGKLEKEKSELDEKLKVILEIPADKIPPRVPKRFSDASTKVQLQVRRTLIQLYRKKTNYIFVPILENGN